MAQRKKGRRAYLDSFHQTPSGDYIYTGATYSLANGSGRTAVRLAVLGAAAVAAEAAAGCFSAPGTGRCFYILLPYAAALIACVLAAWAAVRLAAGGVRLRQYVYDGTVKKLPSRTLAAAVLAGAAALGETEGYPGVTGDITFDGRGNAVKVPIVNAIVRGERRVLRMRG